MFWQLALAFFLLLLAGCSSTPKSMPIIPMNEQNISFYGITQKKRTYQIEVKGGDSEQRLTTALQASQDYCLSNEKFSDRWVFNKSDLSGNLSMVFACVPNKNQIALMQKQEVEKNQKEARERLAIQQQEIENQIKECEIKGYKRGTSLMTKCVSELDQKELEQAMQMLDLLKRVTGTESGNINSPLPQSSGIKHCLRIDREMMHCID